MTLKVIFMGTPDFSIPTLSEIIGKGHEVVAVYTQPPRKAGRGGNLRKTPVHDFAEIANLPVFTPASLKSPEQIRQFRDLDADIAVVIAYGLILPNEIIEACPKGCINIHGSLLPRWRGAAPIQRAIMAGDTETGVMIMQVEEGLDTGDILLAEHIPITPTMTAGELHDEMMHRGAGLLGLALDALERGSLVSTPQPEEGVTYAKKISKGETQIDWSKPARQIHNHIRGISPFPGAWFKATIQMGGEKPPKVERVKVLRSIISDAQYTDLTIEDGNIFVPCGEGTLELVELQREGKKPMRVENFINGLQGELTIGS